MTNQVLTDHFNLTALFRINLSTHIINYVMQWYVVLCCTMVCYAILCSATMLCNKANLCYTCISVMKLLKLHLSVFGYGNINVRQTYLTGF